MEDATGVSELKKQIADLMIELNIAQGKIKQLEEQNQKLSIDTDMADWRCSRLENDTRHTLGYCYLSPTDSRFSVVTSSGGRYCVSVTNVKKYASGSKITLEVVNMYSVGQDGVEASIVVTPITPAGTSYEDIQKQKKTVTDTIGEIPSGTAKRKTFSIPELAPEQLKMLKISITETGIRYRNPS
jgi:hypothetical protein